MLQSPVSVVVVENAVLCVRVQHGEGRGVLKGSGKMFMMSADVCMGQES